MISAPITNRLSYLENQVSDISLAWPQSSHFISSNVDFSFFYQNVAI